MTGAMFDIQEMVNRIIKYFESCLVCHLNISSPDLRTSANATVVLAVMSGPGIAVNFLIL